MAAARKNLIAEPAEIMGSPAAFGSISLRRIEAAHSNRIDDQKFHRVGEDWRRGCLLADDDAGAMDHHAVLDNDGFIIGDVHIDAFFARSRGIQRQRSILAMISASRREDWEAWPPDKAATVRAVKRPEGGRPFAFWKSATAAAIFVS